MKQAGCLGWAAGWGRSRSLASWDALLYEELQRGATRSYEELLSLTKSHWGDALIVREPP